MNVLLFILILSVLVIIHELGHFLMARRFKVFVEEFGVGYPPQAKVLGRDKQGTVYSLNWLPIGGFVRLYGEEGTIDPQAGPKPGDPFYAKPVRQRLLIIAAGVMVNFVFGVLIFAGLYTYIGVQQGGLPAQLGYVRVESVAPGSPAETAGLEGGNEVVGVVTAEGNRVEVTSSEEFIKLVGTLQGQTVTLELQNPERGVPVYVRTKAEIPPNEGSIGVTINDYQMKAYPLWQMPFRGMVIGLESALDLGWLIIKSLGSMVERLFTRGEVPQDVAGPVGIAYMASKEKLLTQGFTTLLNFAAMLSINLAIVNILPIPPLDGGRAVMLVYEGVTKRRFNQEWERKILTWGMLFFLGLILLISIKDVATIVKDTGAAGWLQGLF